MLAQKTYTETAIGARGTMTYGGIVSVGPGLDPFAGYEAFAQEVKEIEKMEENGLVEITVRHQEAQTGRKYIDLLQFIRLV